MIDKDLFDKISLIFYSGFAEDTFLWLKILETIQLHIYCRSWDYRVSEMGRSRHIIKMVEC